jgi:hypothetical protein
MGSVQTYTSRVVDAFRQAEQVTDIEKGNLTMTLVDQNTAVVSLLKRYQTTKKFLADVLKPETDPQIRSKLNALTLLELLEQ